MQWVPKTYSRLVNVSKSYGPAYLGRAVPGSAASTPAPFHAGHDLPSHRLTEATSDAKDVIKSLHARKVPFLDLRDIGEVVARPVRGTVQFHHHDILSGACNRVLPKDREAQMVVFASSRQRAIQGYQALRYHGYVNVAVADAAVVMEALRAVSE